MMEKHGNVVLTTHDIYEYNAGRVSKRVTSMGLSFNQLKELIETKSYSKENASIVDEDDFFERQGSLF